MFAFKMHICKRNLFLYVFKKGYIKKKERLAELQERLKTSEIQWDWVASREDARSKLFIARELLSSALTHPAIRHPSKYIYT